jgi:hypothetical protein
VGRLERSTRDLGPIGRSWYALDRPELLNSASDIVCFFFFLSLAGAAPSEGNSDPKEGKSSLSLFLRPATGASIDPAQTKHKHIIRRQSSTEKREKAQRAKRIRSRQAGREAV